jgi:HEAT repeat protein
MPESTQDADLQQWLTQLRSHDVTLRSDAAHHLGKLGDERAAQALAEALSDTDEYVRKSAVMALRRIGGPAAMEALRTALADRSEQVVLQAVNGLRDMRDSQQRTVGESELAQAVAELLDMSDRIRQRQNHFTLVPNWLRITNPFNLTNYRLNMHARAQGK